MSEDLRAEYDFTDAVKNPHLPAGMCTEFLHLPGDFEGSHGLLCFGFFEK